MELKYAILKEFTFMLNIDWGLEKFMGGLQPSMFPLNDDLRLGTVPTSALK